MVEYQFWWVLLKQIMPNTGVYCLPSSYGVCNLFKFQHINCRKYVSSIDYFIIRTWNIPIWGCLGLVQVQAASYFVFEPVSYHSCSIVNGGYIAHDLTKFLIYLYLCAY